MMVIYERCWEACTTSMAVLIEFGWNFAPLHPQDEDQHDRQSHTRDAQAQPGLVPQQVAGATSISGCRAS
jgi:hypothetical protein